MTRLSRRDILRLGGRDAAAVATVDHDIVSLANAERGEQLPGALLRSAALISTTVTASE
jgi:hypothetical protein